MKCCYREGKEIPPIELIAEEIGCTVNRLKTAIRATQQSRSLDEPVMGQSIRAGAAGGDMVGDELLILDTIECTEVRPEVQVKLSFLRQSLENAMASELSPHDRDVLRLRLGLDDGIMRTTREIIEICGGNLSISEVRLTEQRAYKKLRAPYSVANYQLIAFLDFAGIDQSSMTRF
jgi:DNA-directed RNA polymerase sigma subunit (sigma70/sigma32)